MERLLCCPGHKAGKLGIFKSHFSPRYLGKKAEVTQQISSHNQNTRQWSSYQKNSEVLRHWDLPQFPLNQYLFVDWSKHSRRGYYSVCPSSITFYKKYIGIICSIAVHFKLQQAELCKYKCTALMLSSMCSNKFLFRDKRLGNSFLVIYVKIRISTSQNFSI